MDFIVSSRTLSVQVVYSHILNSILMVNVTRCQWKHLWVHLKHCPRICPQNIRKTPGTKIVTPPKYDELCCDIQLRDSKDRTGVSRSSNKNMPSLRQAFSFRLFFFFFNSFIYILIDLFTYLFNIWCCQYFILHNIKWQNLSYFVDCASRYKFLLMTNLTHFFMYLFHVPTCFECHGAHHQEIELY